MLGRTCSVTIVGKVGYAFRFRFRLLAVIPALSGELCVVSGFSGKLCITNFNSVADSSHKSYSVFL